MMFSEIIKKFEYFHFSSLPGFISWVRYLSLFFYSFNAMMIQLWDSFTELECTNQNVTFIVEGSSKICANPACRYSGDEILQEYGVDKVI